MKENSPQGYHVHDSPPLTLELENGVLYPLVIKDAEGRTLLLVKEDGSREMLLEDSQAVIDIMAQEFVGFGERYRTMQESFLARLEAAERERDALIAKAHRDGASRRRQEKEAEAEVERLRDRLQAITEWKPRDGYMAVHIARAALAARTEEPE